MEHLRKPGLWIGAALILTLLYALFYLTIQQTLRLAANEPQTSMAKDVAADLRTGKKPDNLVSGYIDMSTNMAPFIIIYDQFGKVVAGSGYLDNSIPQVPVGVLAASKGGSTNDVTWQPKQNVRIASVSAKGGDYYVLGGRSLTITEKQIGRVTRLVAAAWLLTILLLVVMYQFVKKRASSSTKHSL
jgi:hypothetical protein